MADRIQLDLTQRQIDGCIAYLKGKARNAVIEVQYHQHPGEISALLEDIKALTQLVEPARSGDDGLVKSPMSDPDAARKLQEAQEAHKAIEAKSIGGPRRLKS